MSKPLGYYTNLTPGDGSLMDQAIETWGNQLEQMSVTEKCWLISSMGHDLWLHDSPDISVSDDVETWSNRSHDELSVQERLGFIEALVNQLKYQFRNHL